MEFRSLKYLDNARAVIGFANSLGWILKLPNWYQAVAPLISLPKKNNPNNVKIEKTYNRLEYLIKKLIGRSWIKRKIKIEKKTKINCLVKGLMENIDSKLYVWEDEKIFPNALDMKNWKRGPEIEVNFYE